MWKVNRLTLLLELWPPSGLEELVVLVLVKQSEAFSSRLH